VDTLNLESMLELEHKFSPLLRLSTRAGFRRGGGLGSEATQILPRQAGPAATARLDWDADRINRLSLVADAEQHRFSATPSNPSGSSTLSNVLAGWTVHTSRQVAVDAAGGAAVFRGPTGGSTAYPAGTLGVAVEGHPREDRTLRGSLRARLLPVINPFVEDVTVAVRGEAMAELSDGRLRVVAEGSSGTAVQGAASGSRDIRLGARSIWALTRTWSVEGGLRSAWTNQVPFVGWQTEAFVGIRWGDSGPF
jgi:hypothetical protein